MSVGTPTDGRSFRHPTEEGSVDFTNHPFLNVIWTFFIIFVWISWFWLLISISVDIFRRHDIGGFAKAIWFIVIIFVPLIGSLIYLISQGSSMAQRSAEEARMKQEGFNAYVREQAGGSAGEIEKAKALLDSGAIDEAEFQQLKAKALA
jgi:ABC-type multidrug transport system fused ATPase/permease subunit